MYENYGKEKTIKLQRLGLYFTSLGNLKAELSKNFRLKHQFNNTWNKMKEINQ